jgi:hypothetical protein
MKKLKYRIIKLEFLYAKECYIAQYKILGIWMSIGNYKNYFTTWNHNTHCNTKEEALFRIINFKVEMKRSSEWMCRTETHIYDSSEL